MNFRDLFDVFGIVAIVFIVLKLCGALTWSWLWILAPIWIPVGLGIVTVTGFALFFGFMLILMSLKYSREND